MKSISIRVYGKVQGVFYRKHTIEQAFLNEVRGYVMNEMDGSVYIRAEGDEGNLKSFSEWCGIGPSGARVDRMEVFPENPAGYTEFMIRRSH
jgi:acylphosphatase